MSYQFFLYLTLLLISLIILFLPNGNYKEQAEQTYTNTYTLLVCGLSIYMFFIYLLPSIVKLLPEGYKTISNIEGIDNYEVGVMIFSVFFVSILSKIMDWDLDSKLAISYIWSIFLLILSIVNIKDYLSSDYDFEFDKTGDYIVLWIISLVLIYQNVSASVHLRKNKY